jgi:hypothetical protein
LKEGGIIYIKKKKKKKKEREKEKKIHLCLIARRLIYGFDEISGPRDHPI